MIAQFGACIEIHGVGPFKSGFELDEIGKANFRCRHLDGMLVGEDRCLINQDLPGNYSLVDLEHDSGEWLGVFENPEANQIAICADQFGYQAVFYAVVGEGRDRTALISASAGGMAALFRKFDVPINPDWVHIVGNFVSERPWTKTMASHRTNLTDVRVLAPGEVLVFGGDASGVTKSDFFDTPRTEYEDLLQRGVSRAIGQIETVSNLPLDRREIRLSGGRDSRIIAAMLVASGMAHHFTITSVNPATWRSVKSRPGLERDLQISAKIAKRYGLSWSEPRGGTRTRLTFEEALSAWQTPFSNKNLELRAGAIHFMPDESALELRGGAGETFRGFRVVSGMLERLEVTEHTSVSEGVEALAKHLYGQRALPNEIGPQLSGRLIELFDNLGTKNLAEGLHRRFAAYRNRAHFGHLRDSASKRSIPFLPLSQPEFVEARNLLSYEERVSGIIAYDIIDLLVPELNQLEFDDGPWQPDQLCGRREVDISKFDIDVGPELAAYSGVQERIEETLAASPVRRKKVGGFDAKSCIIETIEEALFELSDLPGAELNFPPSLRSTLLEKVQTGKRNPNLMLAKALGVLDLSRSDHNPSALVITLGSERMLYRLKSLESGPPLRRWTPSPH